MDQFQTLSLLQMALNTNAIFTVATFFILWVAFRFAGKMREGESTMLGRVLTTVFGLMIIWTGLLVGASRSLSFNAAASSLKAIKASGQTLSVQAEAFLTMSDVSMCETNRGT
jgi:sulfite exporter TauE/SafE